MFYSSGHMFDENHGMIVFVFIYEVISSMRKKVIPRLAVSVLLGIISPAFASTIYGKDTAHVNDKVASGPANWPMFDGNQQHNAVYQAGNQSPLKFGVSWAFREFAGIPLRSPGIDANVLGVAGAAIQTNHQIGDPVGATFTGGMLYADTDSHYVYALNPINGKRVWTQQTYNANMSNPVVQDGIVIIGVGDAGFQYGQLPIYANGKAVIRGYGFSGVDAFRATTGKPLWEDATLGEVMSTPVIIHDTVYFATGGGHVEAVNLFTGHLLWKTRVRSFTNMDALNDDVNPYNGQTIIIVGGTDPGHLYGIDADNGKIVWTVAPKGLSQNGLGEGSPAVSVKHQLIIDDAVVNRTAKQEEQTIFAVNPSTGKLVWQTNMGPGALTPPFKGSSAVMLHNGVAYVESPVTHEEVALNEQTGRIIWHTHLLGISHGAATYVNGTLLLATGNHITTMNASNGHVIATVFIGGSFGVMDPVVVGNTVFLTNGWGWVLAKPLSYFIDDHEKNVSVY